MVTATHVDVRVRVTRFSVRLIKVEWPKGYQLVVGGRLAVTVVGGVSKQHPDLPQYTPGSFPVDFIKWSDGGAPEVKVQEVIPGGGIRRLSVVRACTMLFTTLPQATVKNWAQKGGST